MFSQVFMRKVHRVLVWFMAILGTVMAATGLLLRYTAWVEAHITFVDIFFVRYVHRTISTYFAVALLLMIFTGLWLYIAPVLIRWRVRGRHPSEAPNEDPPAGPQPQ